MSDARDDGYAPKRDPALTRAYLETRAGIGSSADADARILAAAARAVGARPQIAGTPWQRRFRLPMAIAATVVLSFSVVTLVREERPGFESARETLPPPSAAPAAAPSPAAPAAPADLPEPPVAPAPAAAPAAPPVLPETELKRKAAKKEASVVARDAAKDLPKITAAPSAQAGPQAAAEARPETQAKPSVLLEKAESPLRDQVAAAPTAAAPSAPRAADTSAAESSEAKQDRQRELRNADVLAASKGTSPMPAAAPPPPLPPPTQASTAPGAANDALKSRSGIGSSATGPAGSAADAATPEAWLKLIRDLRDANKLDEARASAKRFKTRHPDFRIPEDLKAVFE